MTNIDRIIQLLYEFPVNMEWHNNEELAVYLEKNGVIVQKWVPVTERLPRKSGFYLVIRNFGITGSREVGFFEYREFVTLNGNMFHGYYGPNYDPWYHKSVTHWMPLPEPPKECDEP